MLQSYEVLFSDIIEVDEPIDIQYIPSLIQTHFGVNKQFKHIHIFSEKKVNVYCVIASNYPTKQFFTEPQILEKIIKKNQYTLCVTPYYVALFYEKRFIYMHQFQKNISIEDIKLYVMQKLSLDDLDLIVVDVQEYENLKQTKSAILPMKTINTKDTKKTLVYYLLYITILFVITFVYTNDTSKIKKINISNKNVNEILNTSFASTTFMEILKLLKQEKVYLEHYEYKNQFIRMKIKSMNMDNIYRLTKKLNHTIKIKYIQYEHSSSIFYSEIEFFHV